ncbi:hypothetical protein CR194_04000 [Salipaludibacillus keqinensis]|uniref:DUF5412 domain-containing protein n=1 Tax=Salipaludibacillus keqinensis TaxID=2045207 RepID=A0A323TQD0_9BACI|nr:DUF5412 family protein [Salipaludibacillus keqinensis]PYZ94703.1 hypothetical protein CR194_04000 [Salipaludibacillus keqinensis]
MKKKLIIFIMVVGVVGYGVYYVFFDWSRFKDELITQSVSPDGTYTVNAYVSYGNATVANTVLGELVYNHENKSSKKIYWQYREEHAHIEWLDDRTVMINKIQLNLPHETYDYRSGITP